MMTNISVKKKKQLVVKLPCVNNGLCQVVKEDDDVTIGKIERIRCTTCGEMIQKIIR